MKPFYNKSIVGAVLLTMLASPSLVFAESTTTPSKVKKGEPAFCSRIDVVATRLSDQLTKREELVGTKEKSRVTKLSDKRTSRDEIIVQNRNNGTAKHDAVIKKLTDKANTDVKKAAVVQYKAALTSAVSKRQAAVDAAIKTYRTGVDGLVGGKFTTLDANVAALKQSIATAISTAKASCISGANGETVRKTMQDSIKAAHEKMKSTKTDTEIKTQLKTLLDARNASIKAAGEQFKVESESARTALKTAFGTK